MLLCLWEFLNFQIPKENVEVITVYACYTYSQTHSFTPGLKTKCALVGKNWLFNSITFLLSHSFLIL